MRTTFAFAAFLAIIAAFSVPAIAQKKGPVISIAETGWNFGAVNEGDEADKDITVTNTGDAVLEITKVETSCGCIIPKMEKMQIEPSKSAKLSLHLDAARGGHGEIKKVLTITSNCPQQPKVELTLEGVVKPIWWLKDISINFGEMPNGVVHERTFRIYAAAGAKVNLLKVTTSPAEFEVVGWKDAKDPDGTGGWEVTIRTPKKWESGYFEALCVMETDFKKVPQRGARFFGEFVGKIRVAPEDLAFGAMKPGEKKTLKVTVTKTEGEGMEIVRAESEDKGIATKITEKEKGKSGEVEVTFTAPQSEGSFKGTIQIAVDEPGQRVHTVNFYGRVVP